MEAVIVNGTKDNNAGQQFGRRLAWLGAEIHTAADKYAEIEQDDDYWEMMRLLNKVAYQCIHGKPQQLVPAPKKRSE